MGPRLLHVWVLWALAIAQPIYEVLRTSGEFFVAHEATRADLVLLTVVLSGLLPAVVAAVVWLAARVRPAAGTAAMLLAVAAFVALIAMQGMRAAGGFPNAVTFAAAAAAGALAAFVYDRFAGARQFLTVLSPAVVIFPALLLMHGSVRAIMLPRSPAADAAAVAVGGDTPVVMVVFDQLPLVSLMGGDGNIDAGAFPAFAALQQDALWFRNATTVADLTGWALPAIVSGEYPEPSRLPVTADHPRNLFTVLGDAYAMDVAEPITQLCPVALCPRDTDPVAVKQLSMLSDLSIVYPRIFLPPAIAATLPPLTDNWRDFAQNQDWRRRWVRQRDRDRRAPPERFIASIERDDTQPSLYFLHVLLPHEPYIYMKGGQQFTDETTLPGLAEGRWTSDAWAVGQAYQQHLMQAQYVDTLLGRLVARLKDEGLYDRALLVVTADHGVAFTPRRPFKAIMDSTIPGIVPVPLFVKRPFSRGGEISDRNVQAVDVLPTIADILDVELPWKPAGTSAIGTAEAPAEKTLFYNGARNRRALPASLSPLVSDFTARKFAIFGPPGPDGAWPRLDAPARHIIGRPAAELASGARSQLRLRLNDRPRLEQVDFGSGFVPARLTGQVRGDAGSSARWPLAVAVNGIVQATTWSTGSAITPAGFWSAVVPPSSLRAGRNDIEIYEIDDRDGTTPLRLALKSGSRPAGINLVGADADEWAVETEGVWPLEAGPPPYRWTNGDARVETELAPGEAPSALRVALAPLARATTLTIAVNGCTIFEGGIGAGAWDQTLSIESCASNLFANGQAAVEVKSGTFRVADDARALGVPLSILQLTAARR